MILAAKIEFIKINKSNLIFFCTVYWSILRKNQPDASRMETKEMEWTKKIINEINKQ